MSGASVQMMSLSYLEKLKKVKKITLNIYNNNFHFF